MKHFIVASSIVIVLLAFVLHGGFVAAEIDVREADMTCKQYTRCSECVFDQNSVTLDRRPIVSCAWCPTTGTCASHFENCPNNRTLDHNNKCEDMQCIGAWTTGNIYLCRAGMIFALIFSIALILCSGVYLVWYRTIQQAPWRYDNVEGALQLLLDTHGGAWQASQKAAKPDILSAEANYKITKKFLRRQTYDEWAFGSSEEERYWNQVKRYAFFPLAISGLAGVILTVLLLSSSIRPYFADVYYALALVAGYGSIALMIVYIRLFQPSNATGNPRTYFDLCIFLRGRKIENCFPVVSRSEDKERRPYSPGSGDADSSSDAPMSLKQAACAVEMTPLGVDKKENVLFDQDSDVAAAASGFELDEGVPTDFRSKVQEIIKGDEAILWFDCPDRNIVGIEYNWMYQLFAAGIGFSIFLYVLSSVTPYPELLLPPSSLIVIALLLTIFCFVMFAVLSAGCKRLYLLTTQRLIIVARSLTGTHNINSVNFSDIKFCTLIGYREVNHFVMNLAWERAHSGRRMPRLSTDIFVAVTKLDELLRLLIPRLPSNTLPPTFHDDLVHLRYVWRVHASINLASLFLAPIVIVYSRIFPGGFGVLAMLLVMFVNATLIHRALRVLTTTVAPITVSTGDVKTDASFSVGKALEYVAHSISAIPDAVRRVAAQQDARNDHVSP